MSLNLGVSGLVYLNLFLFYLKKKFLLSYAKSEDLGFLQRLTWGSSVYLWVNYLRFSYLCDRVCSILAVLENSVFRPMG